MIIAFLLIGVQSFAQTLPPNIGFEEGTFANWVCSAGSINADGVITLSESSGPVAGRHTLFNKTTSAGVLDPYGNFPVVCPNGSNYSIRLGNEDKNAQAEGISYTFTVPNTANQAYSITFNYAVVLQNPTDHAEYQQPKFTARVYDITDNKYVDCPSFNFVAGTALPGFKLSSTQAAGGRNGSITYIYYKDWSTATLDLHQYLGKSMRIEFVTNDCTKNGHFGYAYLDIDEGNSTKPISGSAYCTTATSVTLKGPDGFAGYLWYNADFSKLLGSEQSLKISPPPPDLTKYALKILPYDGLGCVDTLYTVVNKINDGFKLAVQNTVTGCAETGADLTAAYVTAGSTDSITYSYFTDSTETTHITDPSKILTAGTYYIKGVSNAGCMATLPVQVKLIAPTLNINQPASVRFPATVDLTTTFVKVDSTTYAYYADTAATVPLENYKAIPRTGEYYIKATNSMGCSIIKSVKVTVLPPPPYILTAPNAFTPNNDGVNDTFSLHIEGYVSFDKLEVYNRYGQLIYTEKQNAVWNGYYNGHDLPTGTYYWIFNGSDTYYNTPIKKSGYVAIIR
ncbi:MAG: gliding motility-associated C-terminal domain-containing protein [Bacteroidota bacterium]